jgi:hypothetical protein
MFSLAAEVDWDEKASAIFHTRKSKRPLWPVRLYLAGISSYNIMNSTLLDVTFIFDYASLSNVYQIGLSICI